MRHSFLIGGALLISTLCYSQRQFTVGQKITGDFNGDGKTDTAFLKTKAKQKTMTHKWILFFNDESIPVMQLGCCDAIDEERKPIKKQLHVL